LSGQEWPGVATRHSALLHECCTARRPVRLRLGGVRGRISPAIREFLPAAGAGCRDVHNRCLLAPAAIARLRGPPTLGRKRYDGFVNISEHTRETRQTRAAGSPPVGAQRRYPRAMARIAPLKDTNTTGRQHRSVHAYARPVTCLRERISTHVGSRSQQRSSP
jgi:hypothetical protein